MSFYFLEQNKNRLCKNKMPSLCATCETFSLDRPVISSSKRPEWLKKRNYVKEFIERNHNLEARRPADADQDVKISFGKDYAGRHVLYWAAESSSSLLVSDAKNAYGIYFSNNGITRLDSKGNALIHLRCPQIYSTKEHGSSETKSFFRHFHMTLLNKTKTEWEDRVFTQLLIAKRSFFHFFECLRSGHQITLNATQQYEDEQEKQMPWWEVLTSEQVKGMKKNEVQRLIRKICHKRYPELSKLLKLKKLHISEVPIICYSFDKEYEDSPKLARELVEQGFLRVDILFSEKQGLND